MNEEERATGLSADEAREAVASSAGPRVGVIDLREEEEFVEGHIPSAFNIQEPSAEDLEGVTRGRAEVESWLFVCADGKRSRQVANGLAEQDLEITWLDGGMGTWPGHLQPRPDIEFEGPTKQTL